MTRSSNYGNKTAPFKTYEKLYLARRKKAKAFYKAERKIIKMSGSNNPQYKKK